MNPLKSKPAIDLLRQVARPLIASVAQGDEAPVELFEATLAAELVPHVYRPRLSTLSAGASD